MGSVDRHVDLDVPGEGGGGQVGGEHQPVGMGPHGGGQPVGGRSSVCRRSVEAPSVAHVGRLPSRPCSTELATQCMPFTGAAGRPRLDVVAVGNALVDVLASATDEELVALDLVKGTMALVDQVRSESIYATMGPTTEASGGSAANTAAGVAALGGRVGLPRPGGRRRVRSRPSPTTSVPSGSPSTRCRRRPSPARR